MDTNFLKRSTAVKSHNNFTDSVKYMNDTKYKVLELVNTHAKQLTEHNANIEKDEFDKPRTKQLD